MSFDRPVGMIRSVLTLLILGFLESTRRRSILDSLIRSHRDGIGSCFVSGSGSSLVPSNPLFGMKMDKWKAGSIKCIRSCAGDRS